MMRIKSTMVFIFFIAATASFGQVDDKEYPAKMDWFHKAKFGIFMHWGIYSANLGTASWQLVKGTVAYDEYMNEFKNFTCENYDPNQWAKLFKEAGAKYAVLTSKHHDGVALWPTKQSPLSVYNHSPYKKDLVKQYADAMRKEGIKVGLYFSHLDWSEPTFPNNKMSDFRKKVKSKYVNPKEYNTGRLFNWEKFITLHRGQLRELSENYNPDLFWYDGDWAKKPSDWKMHEVKEMLLKHNPNVIMNDRMSDHSLGDYISLEFSLPVQRPLKAWEHCMKLGPAWSYSKGETYQSTTNVVKIFTECLGMGGNFLLNVGPKADGTIPEEAQKILRQVGRWIKRNEEAVYETRAGLPHGHFFGPSSHSTNQKAIYLYVFGKPSEEIKFKGVLNKITKITCLTDGSKVAFRGYGGAGSPKKKIAKEYYMKLKKNQFDKYVTVIKVE